MEKTRRLRTWGGFLLLLLLLLIFLIWNILAGSVRLPVSEIWTILQGGGELSQRRILLQIRLPRLLAALILGGALSVSGYLLQTFFQGGKIPKMKVQRNGGCCTFILGIFPP